MILTQSQHAHHAIGVNWVILDAKLASLVRDLDNVRPLEVMDRLSLPEYLDPGVTIGNEECVAVFVLCVRV